MEKKKQKNKMLVGKEASKHNLKSMKKSLTLGILRTYLLMKKMKFISLFFNL